MRPKLALVLALCALLAGCAKSTPPSDEPSDEARAAPTGTGAGPGTGASSGAPSSSPSPAPTPPPSSASRYDSSYMGYYPHDFGGAPSSKTLQVPASAPKVDISMGFFMMPTMTGECDTGGARITLDGPSGASRMALDAGTHCATGKNWTNVTLAPGAWTLRFDGRGSGNGFATIGPHDSGGKNTSGAAQPFRAKKTHDFLRGAEETQKLVVPTGAGAGTLTLRLTPDAMSACLSSDASIDVRAPGGASVARLAMATPPNVPDTCPPVKRVTGVAFEPGEWRIVFTGAGPVTGTVEFAAS